MPRLWSIAVPRGGRKRPEYFVYEVGKAQLPVSVELLTTLEAKTPENAVLVWLFRLYPRRNFTASVMDFGGGQYKVTYKE